MSAFIGFATGLMLACCGWTALSLAMDRHYADIHGRGKEPSMVVRRLFRAMGTLALLAAFAVCVMLEGWTIGPVLCLGTDSCGADTDAVAQLCATLRRHRWQDRGGCIGVAGRQLAAWIDIQFQT